jgi:hypothetical protein
VFCSKYTISEVYLYYYNAQVRRLLIPGITDDNADIKQLVKKALSSDIMGDWLMIIDNADNPRVFMGTIDGDPRSARLSDHLRKVIEARSSSRHEVERLPEI